MDKNTITGLLLMFLLILGYQWYMTPSEEQIAAQKRTMDSIAQYNVQDSLAKIAGPATPAADQPMTPQADSARTAQLSGVYGPFALAASGVEQTSVLENELIRIEFTNKGGRIKQVLVKNYYKSLLTEDKKEVDMPLYLQEDEKNQFDFKIPLVNGSTIRSGDLYFTPSLNGNTLTFTAPASTGGSLKQVYSLGGDSYELDHSIDWSGISAAMDTRAETMQLEWVNYLDRLERNTSYERNYTTVYFREADENPTSCSCTSDDTENLTQPVKWVSHSNQFFNSTLQAKEGAFASGVMTTVLVDENSEDLKKLTSALAIPLSGNKFDMHWYIGPNDFNRLSAFGDDLEDIIPFGWSIFGTINRWIVRPLFSVLSGFIGNMGIVILLLTILVKGALYPLTYRMLRSQSKMALLKPRIASLKEKHKDDSQKVQMETMKMYQEYGVNPLGGCLPIALQMPIWFALYRFFPGSIEFRQESFLWATDLSSFDAAFYLPFDIPFYGSHVSLFTILWAGSTLLYTYYNSKHMDFSAQPAMLYMQYLMPVMFLFFFNNYASGLTCYLLFSNLFNVAQTVITKNYIIDNDKLERELQKNKEKPKKKSKFRARLDKAMEESKKMQAEMDKKKKGKK